MSEQLNGEAARIALVPPYCLLTFDAKGSEVPPARVPMPEVANPKPVSTGQILADLAAAATRGEPVTDVLIVSHGWLADVNDAVASYDEWLAVTKQQRPATLTPDTFRPLIIAIHWPSKPHTLLNGTRRGIPFSTHPDAPVSAGGRAPGEPPQPHLLYRFATGVMFFFPWISFFRMKARAELIGQNGVATLIRAIQEQPGTRNIHVMGHSFGAKVVAEAISMNGDPAANRRAKTQFTVAPVASMFLLEGAFSTWAFAGSGTRNGTRNGAAKGTNPYGTTDDGSVASIFAESQAKVAGVAVAGTSRWDYALRRVFPGGEYLDLMATRLRHGRWPFRRTTVPGDPAIASLVGAVGTWGFSFDPADQAEQHMDAAAGAAPTQHYGFQPFPATRRPYHLIMDDVVDLTATTSIVAGQQQHWGGIVSGAHSNIAHPEVAHAYWEAVTASRVSPAR